MSVIPSEAMLQNSDNKSSLPKIAAVTTLEIPETTKPILMKSLLRAKLFIFSLSIRSKTACLRPFGNSMSELLKISLIFFSMVILRGRHCHGCKEKEFWEHVFSKLFFFFSYLRFFARTIFFEENFCRSDMIARRYLLLVVFAGDPRISAISTKENPWL